MKASLSLLLKQYKTENIVQASFANKKPACQRILHSFARLLCVFFLVTSYSNAHAEDSGWDDALTIHGFYTADLTYSDSDVVVISNGHIVRPLEEDEFTLKNAIFGLQGRYNFNDDFSAYLQGTALFDRSDDFETSLEWAYFSYDVGNDLTARLGLFQIPLLQGTELKSVGYSRLWARPLVPGSGAGGFIEHVGIEFLKNIALQGSNLSFQIAIGEAEHDLDFIDGKFLGLLSAKYSFRAFWVRAALLQINYEIFTPRGQLIDGDASAVMASIEAEIEFNDFIINAGLSDSNADITPDDGLAYLSIAYRSGNFTPYILGRVQRQHFNAFQVPLPPPAGPGPPPPPPPATLDGDNDINTLAIGFRLNLSENYAIKMQLENIDRKDASRAAQGIISEEGNVLSILLEGVF